MLGHARGKIIKYLSTFLELTDVLFDLAAKEDFAHTFREVYQDRGFSLRAASCSL